MLTRTTCEWNDRRSPVTVRESGCGKHTAPLLTWRPLARSRNKLVQEHLRSGARQGRRPVRIPDPNPPLPRAEFFFLPFLRGFFFLNPFCLCSKYSEFCGDFKNV